jgi:single-strand DNA-binding protein
MASLAKVTLIGNLGRDPETRYTPSGVMNVRFTLATNRRWTDQNGQVQERTTWFNVTAWRRLAESIDQMSQRGWVSKGRQVYVYGTLETHEYQDQQGQTRTSIDVTADDFQLLGNRPDGDEGGYSRPSGGPGGGRSQEPDNAPSDFDDVPF